jgi:hypothetical protein
MLARNTPIGRTTFRPRVKTLVIALQCLDSFGPILYTVYIMTNTTPGFKSAQENYNDTLDEARTMTVRELKDALAFRLAYHSWAVRAYEKALTERIGPGWQYI